MNNENENKDLNLILNKNSKAKPLFFVDKNEISIQLFVVYDNLSGRLLNVSTSNLAQQLSNIQGVSQTSYQFVFTKPNYEQISRYRQLAMYWDNRANKTIVNPFKLRNYLILNHLKSWKGVTDQYGDEIELQLDNDDTLTQKSLETVYSVNSSIIDVLMTQYESKAMLY